MDGKFPLIPNSSPLLTHIRYSTHPPHNDATQGARANRAPFTNPPEPLLPHTTGYQLTRHTWCTDIFLDDAPSTSLVLATSISTIVQVEGNPLGFWKQSSPRRDIVLGLWANIAILACTEWGRDCVPRDDFPRRRRSLPRRMFVCSRAVGVAVMTGYFITIMNNRAETPAIF